jgi:hypothetical protein
MMGAAPRLQKMCEMSTPTCIEEAEVGDKNKSNNDTTILLLHEVRLSAPISFLKMILINITVRIT